MLNCPLAQELRSSKEKGNSVFLVTWAIKVLVLSLIVSPAAVTARAQQAHLSSHQGARVKLEVHDDLAARALMVRVGPIDLPARSNHTRLPDLFLPSPFDGWLSAYHPKLIDDRGRTLPGELLHHVAFFSTARRDFICENGEESIFIAGREMTNWPTLPGMGYPIDKGYRIRI